MASDITKSRVALIFPPLVATNVGRYYPSTAVLAGALASHGYASCQIDLNAALASACLNDAALRAAGAGHLIDGTSLPLDAMPAIAARLLVQARPVRNRSSVFSEAETLPEFSFQYLVGALLDPLRIDEPIETLISDKFAASRLACFYRDFFAHSTELAKGLRAAALVGISVPMGPQLAPALILARVIKEKSPDTLLILGGPTFSLMAPCLIEAVLRAYPVNAVVRFEGERPLVSLADQCMHDVWEPWTVPGASSIGVRRGIVHAPARPGVSLDELAFAEYDPAVVASLQEPELSVVQSRGCYWGRCAYCDYVELYRGSQRFRTRTVGRFVDEIEYQIRTHGVRRFAVICEALPPAFARQMALEIIERRLGLTWSSFAMVDDRFTSDTLKLLARSGCEHLIVGLETMTDRVLRLVRKAASRAANTAFLRRVDAAKIRVSINLIPDLPTTTFQEATDALRDVEGLRPCFRYVSIFPFEATVSSAIGTCPNAFGLNAVNEPAGAAQAQFISNHLVVRDVGMSKDERLAVYNSYRMFARTVNTSVALAQYGQIADESVGHDIPLRILDDVIDVLPIDGGALYYHCLTLEHFRMSSAWNAVLESLRSRKSFTFRDLEAWLPPDLASSLIARLIGFRLVGVVGPVQPEA